jgi:hypothetical protein
MNNFDFQLGASQIKWCRVGKQETRRRKKKQTENTQS